MNHIVQQRESTMGKYSKYKKYKPIGQNLLQKYRIDIGALRDAARRENKTAKRIFSYGNCKRCGTPYSLYYCPLNTNNEPMCPGCKTILQKALSPLDLLSLPINTLKRN